MIAFRVSAAAAAVFAAAGIGQAAERSDRADSRTGYQVGQAMSGPVQLGPRRPATGAPPPPASMPEAAPVAPTSPSGVFGPVEVQALQAVDPDSVGIIDDQDGGLGADMWAGADRAFVGRLLALLPRRVGSPTMRDLMKRLLLTRAMAPERAPDAPSLLSLRVDALFALGELESAAALLAGAPIGPANERRLRFEVESRFFRQDTAGACDQVRGAAQDYKDDYWQQATAYCLALAGRTAEAALLSDILAERAASLHPAFFAAMDRLAGAPPPTVKSLSQPSALYLSMMRTASLALPADVLANASPAVENAVALSPNAPLELRLAAAEQAAAHRVLPGSVLHEIYGAMRFDENALNSPVSRAEADWGPGGRALLMRAAAGQPVPPARAEALQQAFRLARAKGGYQVVAVASQPLLNGIEPSADLAWFAGEAARALVTAGDFAAARTWIELGLGEARGGDLWPLALLGGVGGGEVTAEAFQAWRTAREKAGAADPKADAGVLFGLLDALGIAVPTALWTPVLEASRPEDALVPGTGLRVALGRAAAVERRGETVALALVALGNAGPAPANLLAVDLAVRALGKVGLAAEARRLALETAVAAGL